MPLTGREVPGNIRKKELGRPVKAGRPFSTQGKETDMGKRMLSFVCALFLLAVSAAAYEGAGYTVDIPADWQLDGETDSGSTWALPDGSTNYSVMIGANQDGANLYDVGEDDLSQLESEYFSAEDLQSGFEAQGIDCTVTIVQQSAKLTEHRGIPTMRLSVEFQMEVGGLVIPLYEEMLLQFTPEHSFIWGYAGSDADAMTAAVEDGVWESFAVTEEGFDGPSPDVPLWEQVLSSGVFWALLAVAVLAAVRLVRRKRRSKAEGSKAKP